MCLKSLDRKCQRQIRQEKKTKTVGVEGEGKIQWKQTINERAVKKKVRGLNSEEKRKERTNIMKRIFRGTEERKREKDLVQLFGERHREKGNERKQFLHEII